MSDPTARLNDLRAKVLAGEEVTTQELSEALAALRTQRASSMTKKIEKAEKKSSAAALATVDLSSLFSGPKS